ncbi:hypothetical protein U1Q18_011876, partial [Sarracenia purpurea var. burkii]
SPKKKYFVKRERRQKPSGANEKNQGIYQTEDSDLRSMEWVRGGLVGHGSFGTVSLAIPRCRNQNQSLQTPPLMAVKSCGLSESALILNEKSILEELGDCPQIIRCFGADFTFENGEELCNLLLEYASGGALSEKLKNSSNRRLPESEVQRYTKSILEGLHCIHKNGYVHCDIKPQNILLCSSKDGDDVAKIADFGLAKKAGLKREKSGVELRGTPLFMAPETVTTGEQEAAGDVWALGCLVAEMVTGAPAWRCRPGAEIWGLLIRIGVGDEVPEIPENLSEEGKDFLGKCFVKDPEKRWTAKMLLDHPFVVERGYDRTYPVPLQNACEEASPSSSSTSPRGPFDVHDDWEFVQSPPSIPFPSPDFSGTSPAEKLRQLATDERPDWRASDRWITVR